MVSVIKSHWLDSRRPPFWHERQVQPFLPACLQSWLTTSNPSSILQPISPRFNDVTVTPLLWQLHWLPIRKDTNFKFNVLAYSCLHRLSISTQQFSADFVSWSALTTSIRFETFPRCTHAIHYVWQPDASCRHSSYLKCPAKWLYGCTSTYLLSDLP